MRISDWSSDVCSSDLLSIDAKAAGPVHDALSILDHPRLDLLSRLGMAAEGSGGTVDADLHFNFPLKKDLDFDDVSLQVAAAVADGAMRNVLLDQDMPAAQLQVRSEEHTSELQALMRISY